MAQAIQRKQCAENHRHLWHRQRNIEPVVDHQDRHDLSQHGNPAQLDQQREVLAIGRLDVGRRT
jgi:hypothetical protein